ncbi:hypothetical protein ACHWQZ_G002704 [Mnemiopsis leidyi]
MDPDCCICREPLAGVRAHLDHDHRAGKALGFAHPKFDGHFLIKALAKRRERLGRLAVIAKSMESYIAIITSKFRFIDSLAHLNAGLNELVSNLNQDSDSFSEIKEFVKEEH